MAEPFARDSISHVIGIESRGFILGAPIAQQLGAGFIPVRKPGKLPHTVERVDYQLEYGTDALEHIGTVPRANDLDAVLGLARRRRRSVRRDHANAVSQLDGFRGETRDEGACPVAIPSWIVVRDRQNAHGGVQKVAPARVAIQGAAPPVFSSGAARAPASAASR